MADDQPYDVRLIKAATQYIASLPKKDAALVARVLQALTKDPRAGAEKLKENPKLWRARAGNHRVIYAIRDDLKMVIVARVRDRKDVYRDLSRLDPIALIREISPDLAKALLR
jgi:mRNA-degrading endonuclease RelE of RelBE toxin-antitoxin system